MLKVSAFYLEKQKSFIPKKKYFLSRTAKVHPKEGVSRLNFPEGFECDFISIVSGLIFILIFQVITEKAAQTTIHLLMQGANALDSGVYECFPDNAPPAKIKVHILTAGKNINNASF